MNGEKASNFMDCISSGQNLVFVCVLLDYTLGSCLVKPKLTPNAVVLASLRTLLDQ